MGTVIGNEYLDGVNSDVFLWAFATEKNICHHNIVHTHFLSMCNFSHLCQQLLC